MPTQMPLQLCLTGNGRCFGDLAHDPVRAGHRDTQAIHAKLDDLLPVDNRARNEPTHLDDREPEEIERHRAAART